MRRLVLVLAFVTLGQAPLAAQVQAELTYRIGAFVPLEDLRATVDAAGNSLTVSQDSRFSIGGRLGLWLDPYFGLEGTIEYGRSGQTSFLNGVPQSAAAGHVLAASARGVLRLGKPRGRIAFVVSGGGGLTDRNDLAIAGLGSRTEFGPVAGAGLRVRLTPAVTARIDVDGFTYRPDFIDAAGRTSTGERQYDLWITFGLTGPFGSDP
jgi:hypothetical protein